jgi:hypothetical protein
MPLRLFALFAALVVVLTGCNTQAPPTQIVLVVTATPNGEPTAESTVTATSATTTSPATTALTLTPTLAPTVAATVAPSATPNVFPTATVGEIQVAEQLFQGGRMFWVQPTQQLWVLEVTSEGRGSWTIYPDTFQEGVDPDVDSALVAPSDGLLQPERGFGKLWRNNQDVRDALGWATGPEFGYVSRYEYHPGGSVNAQGQYVAGPGYHILFSLYQEKFRFNEVDGTWQLGDG